MNYTISKNKCVSGFIDLSNDNASTCFCLMSDSIPETDNIFNIMYILKIKTPFLIFLEISTQLNLMFVSSIEETNPNTNKKILGNDRINCNYI